MLLICFKSKVISIICCELRSLIAATFTSDCCQNYRNLDIFECFCLVRTIWLLSFVCHHMYLGFWCGRIHVDQWRSEPFGCPGRRKYSAPLSGYLNTFRTIFPHGHWWCFLGKIFPHVVIVFPSIFFSSFPDFGAPPSQGGPPPSYAADVNSRSWCRCSAIMSLWESCMPN